MQILVFHALMGVTIVLPIPQRYSFARAFLCRFNAEFHSLSVVSPLYSYQTNIYIS